MSNMIRFISENLNIFSFEKNLLNKYSLVHFDNSGRPKGGPEFDSAKLDWYKLGKDFKVSLNKSREAGKIK
jgi:hypothetical protein